ncbi:MAG: ABC transporter ATP-binding protein [Epsilonproteobacteria bacterium]|nr:MAG: ABC transporter ATP-binding protein [Campylobacterota bacterium]
MALITAQNIIKKYDTKVVLDDVSLNIHKHQKIAVLGQNGQGKSTLINILIKNLQPDSGSISIDNSLSIKKLDQNPTMDSQNTVKQTIEAHIEELSKAKSKYEYLTNQLSTDFENKNLIQEHCDLSNFLDDKDGWDIEHKLQRVMTEFRLVEFQDKLIGTLSGGEQRRVALSAILLQNPDMLLLDEPTNHLDVHMVEYLENFLYKSNITLVFISHDRYFIDAIATNIYEINDAKIQKYKGGYADYLKQKEQLVNTKQKEQDNLKKKLKEEILWMQKGVQARRKRDERRKKDYLKLKEFVKTNPKQINKMTIELQREQRSFNHEKSLNKKKLLFEIDNISKTIENKTLIKNFSTTIRQKDCIAVVGPNGCGKSTLLNILIDKIKQDTGTIKKAEFGIGYFDQNRKLVNDENTILQTFCPNGGEHIKLSDGRQPHVYGYLKGFLFPKEYLHRKIGDLSGGEKNRVALALLFTKKVELLILDEPTNDLDIPTINILEQYLNSFQGAIIFVSHDRYFVDKIAKKLFVFEQDGDIVESYCQYSQYLSYQKSISQIKTLNKQTKKSSVQQIKPKPKPIKFSFNDKRELDSLSKTIEQLEKQIDDIQKCMKDKICYETKGLVALSIQLDDITKDYEKKANRFLELELKREKIQNA